MSIEAQRIVEGSPIRANWIEAVHEKNKNAVVRVQGYGLVEADVEGKKREAEIQMGHGSGFCVAVKTNENGERMGYFITNRHVLEGALLRGLPPRIFLANGAERQVVRHIDDRTSYFRDVAVLEVILKPGDEVSVVEQRSKPLRVGEDVVVMGSPGASDTWTSAGKVTRLPVPGVFDHTPVAGQAMEWRMPKSAVDQGYGIDVNDGPGSSGGPLFDSEGRLAGIGGHNDNTGEHKSIFIPNHDVEAYLRYPKEMLDIKKVFDAIHEVRSAEDVSHLRDVFSKALLPLCVKLIQDIPAGERKDAARIIFGDSAVRVMFADLILASSRTQIEWYNNKFNEVLGPFGVPPLFVSEGINALQPYRSDIAREIRDKKR